jgi:hypothetical protein
MLKKLISTVLVTVSLIAASAGCRTQARVSTPHHSVGVGGGVH